MRKLLIAFTLVILPLGSSWSRTPLIGKFDHQFHEQKVFKPNNVSCSVCHNLNTSAATDFKATEELKDATFKKPIKQLCHDCHTGTTYPSAVKQCIFCHDTKERLLQIKPLSHENVAFKERHATEARAFGGQCLNCHTNTQCVKCHVTRNEVINQNHSRNYRYYHSIEARMSPHKCDTCHTQTFCIRCHVGAK